MNRGGRGNFGMRGQNRGGSMRGGGFQQRGGFNNQGGRGGFNNGFNQQQNMNRPNNQAAGGANYKTVLCRHFEKHGWCKYGDNCNYAHGEAELRRPT